MNKKVKVTPEQARAIKLTKNCNNEKTVLKYITQDKQIPNERFRALSELSLNDLMNAFTNGYEIEPQFKVGDWVRQDVGDGYRVGKVTEYNSSNRILVGFVEYKSLFNAYTETFDPSEIALATSEEIDEEIERQLWTKLGREAGEFQEGDVVVRNHGCGDRAMSIVDLFGEGITASEARAAYSNNELEGMFPKELFIKF
ncbi:hypothetical protein [Bacillus sp. FJAT-22090]|uniref:hypothetical protein n=1 Tax=Bacillus sp. FJAT-22090 TaxID=1581038 RepID=UPI00119DA6F2|nr:hypothetical protein [Bacillus sp. FJAT-22090]